MTIDSKQVKWDEPTAPTAIDTQKVEWDSPSEPAAPARSTGAMVKDRVLDVAKGAVNLVGGALAVGEQAPQFKIARTLTESLTGAPAPLVVPGAIREANAALSGEQSEYAQGKQQELSETEGFLPTVKKVLTTPEILAQQATQQIPNLIGTGVGVARAGANAAARAAEGLVSRGATREAAAVAPEVIAARTAAAERTVVGANAAMEAGPAAGQAYEEALAQPEEVWQSNPDYVAAVANGESADVVKVRMARSAADIGGGIGALFGGLGGKVAAPFEAKLFTRTLPQTGVAGTAAQTLVGAGREGAEEALQEGGSQFGSNVGVSTVDPNKRLLEGVPEAAGAGAAVGSVIGGSLALGGRAATQGEPQGVPVPERTAPSPPEQTPEQREHALRAAYEASPTQETQDALMAHLTATGRLLEPPSTIVIDSKGNAQTNAVTPPELIDRPKIRLGSVPGGQGSVLPARPPELIDPTTGATSPLPNPADGPLSRVVAQGAASGAVATTANTVAVPAPTPEEATSAALQQQALDLRTQAEEVLPAPLRARHEALQAAVDAAPTPEAEKVAKDNLADFGERFKKELTQYETSHANADDIEAAVKGDRPPPNMDPVTGELMPVDEAQVRAVIHAGFEAGQPHDVGKLVSAFGLTRRRAGELRQEVARERKLAAKAAANRVENPAVDEPAKTSPLSSTPETAAPSASQGGGGLVGAEAAESSPLAIDDSDEVLDTDVLTPSGNPFTIRAAAESAARREGNGAQVVALASGEFVVRKPTAPAAGSVLQAAANAAATSPANDRPEPTQAQKEAGNYAKGHARIAGLDVSIENPAGTKRRPEWPPLNHHYGYIKRTEGNDGDHVDVFLTDRAEDTTLPVFVVDQTNRNGAFDEHKVVMGTASEEEARAAYLSNYAKGWNGLGAITQMTLDEFKAWVRDPSKTKAPVGSLRETKAAKTGAKPALRETKGPKSGPTAPKAETGRRAIEARILDADSDPSAADVKALGLPRRIQARDAVRVLRDLLGITKSHAEDVVSRVPSPPNERVQLRDPIDVLRAAKQLRVGLQRAREPAPAATTPDRRQDRATRAAVDALPPDARDAELERLRARVAELETGARVDALTGLPNKAAFDADASLGWPSVAAIDMDGLKRLNDAIGHDAADAVLRRLGELLAAQAGDGTRFYRRSGDEFAARFADAAQADTVMAAVQQAMESEVVTFTVKLADGDAQAYAYNGIGISFGTGDNYEVADAAANRNKADRLAAGVREEARADGAPRRLRAVPGNSAGSDSDRIVPEPGPAEEPAEEVAPTPAAATTETPADAGVSASEVTNAASVARQLAAARPFDDVAKVRNDARAAIIAQLGESALIDLDAGNFLRPDELTQAVHDGQYDAIKRLGASLAVPVLEDDIGIKLATAAHEGTSHSPDSRGRFELRNYVRTMVDAWNQAITAAGDDPDAVARVTAEMEKLRRGYADRIKAYLSSHSRVMSAMIAGPARFPVASNRKKSDSADRRAQEANEFLKRQRARMIQAAAVPVDTTPTGEAAAVRANLAQREARQERMKAVNAAIRKGDDAALNALGYNEAAIATLKKPDVLGRIGFPDYSLKNNNAEIRRLRERLKVVDRRVVAAEAGPVESTFAGMRIVEDAEDNRVRLFFDGKPDEGTRERLRGSGWKWSPKNGAWQRQLTPNARASAAQILAALTKDTQGGAANVPEEPAAAVVITTADLPPKPASGTMRDAVRDAARARLAEKVAITRDGAEIIIPWQGIKKASENANRPALAALLRIDEIIAASTLRASAPDRRGRPEIIAVHEYVAPVEIDGKAGRAVVFVREARDGKRFYDQAIIENGEPAGIPGESARTDANRSSVQPAAGSDNSVRPSDESDKNGSATRPEANAGRGVTFSIGIGEGDLRRAVASAMRGWTGDIPIVRVVQDANRLPNAAKRHDGWERFEGWYDGQQTIYIVASNVPNIARAMQTLAHEAFGHYGVEGVVGRKEWAQIIADVARLRKNPNASPKVRAALDAAERRYGKESPLQFAREALAVMAERGVRASVIDRVLTAVRRFLRSIGVRWNGTTLAEAELLTIVAGGMRRVTEGGRDSDAVPLGAAASRADLVVDVAETTEPTDGFFARMSAVLKPGNVSLTEAAKGRLFDLTPTALGALTLRHLADLGGKYLPQLRSYVDTMTRMQTDRNVLQEEANGQAEKWEKWQRRNRVEARAVADLMHDATIAGVDPAAEYQPLTFRTVGGEVIAITPKAVRELERVLRDQMRGRPGDSKRHMLDQIKELRAKVNAERARRRSYPLMLARWNGLSPAAQAIYVEARDMYSKRDVDWLNALIERIGALELDGAKRALLIARLRSDFESNRATGPYFPLQRFGKFWIAATNPDTKKRDFFMFESSVKQTAARKDLARQGYTELAFGTKLEQAKDVFGASAGFMADLAETLKKSGAPDDAVDDVWQLYLHTLPDLSQRKHFIHRKKVEGYSPDALRAFAANMNHGAHQIARLRHGHTLQSLVQKMKQQVDGLTQTGQGNQASMFYNEASKRHDWVMNPQDSAVVNKIGGLGFAWYLGLTPGAALVNLTQTAIVAFPVLGSKFGAVKAMNALTKAMAEATATYGNIERRLTDDERRAFAAMRASGAIDKTQAHNLAGLSEADTSDYSGTWHRVMTGISHLFHKAEVINREATGVAAYRLARESGMGFDGAVQYANDAIWESHFDYSNANRARFMQSGAAKVLLMFRQYSLNMTYFLWRNFYQTFKGASPEVRSDARRKLVGVLGMTSLFSGTLGLPLMSVGFGVANAVANALGDDEDPPFDAEAEFRNFLTDFLGAEAAEFIARGPVNFVTGADVGGRVSLDNLWLREPERELEGRALADYWLEQAAGPIGGIFVNAVRGMATVQDGHVQRGIEAMVPKAIKDGMRSMRYATEGVNTLRGDAVVPDLSPYETVLQLAGLSPARVGERYDANNAVKRYEEAVLKRRASLLDAFAMAIRFGDAAAASDVADRITAFNERNPAIAIDRKTLKRSLESRTRYSERSEGGIIVNPRLEALAREQGRFAGG